MVHGARGAADRTCSPRAGGWPCGLWPAGLWRAGRRRTCGSEFLGQDRLALRAEVDVPFFLTVGFTQHAAADGCAAFEARLVLTPVDPVTRTAGPPTDGQAAG